MEQCENCGRTIGKLETAHVFQDHVVCAECNARLNRGQQTTLAERPTRPARGGFSPFLGVAFVLVVIFGLGFGALWLMVPPLPSYQGKSAAEWRRLADDADPKTRQAAYEALVYTKQSDVLLEKFDHEYSTDAKITIARYTVDFESARPKVIKFVTDLLKDQDGWIYLRRDDLLFTVQILAIKGEAGPFVQPLEAMKGKGYADYVQPYIDEIKAHPQKN